MGHERGDCALNGPKELAVLGAGTSGTTQKVPTPGAGPNLRVGCGRPHLLYRHSTRYWVDVLHGRRFPAFAEATPWDRPALVDDGVFWLS